MLQKTFYRLKNNKILLSGLILSILITSSFATYFFYKSNLNKQANLTNLQDNILGGNFGVEPLSEPNGNIDTLSFLLLGYGGAGHQGGFLTDVIQIAYFDFDKSRLALISIPRDLWVTLPSGKANKINSAFASDIKNASQAIEMAETVSGLHIDYFLGIDFVGFQRTIGYEFKNIEVNVPEALNDPWYPIEGKQQDPCGKTPQEIADLTANYSGFKLESQFECRYEHIKFDKGRNIMDGHDALAYVRSRHGSKAGDFSRSQRQHALLEAIKNKIFNLRSLDQTTKFFNQMIKHLNTNIDLKIAKYLAPMLKSSQDFEIIRVTLTTKNVFVSSKSSSGQFILLPKSGMNNWASVRQYIQNQLK